MSTVTTSASEMTDSLTGYDELAIKKAFELGLRELGNEGNATLRALIFVDKRRGGLNDKQAYAAAMELPMGQLRTYFADEPDDVDPEDPETDAGKDD